MSQAVVLNDSYWRKHLEPYEQASTRAAVVQLLNTALPFGLLWFLMARSLNVSYALTLVLALPTGFLLVRLWTLQHDCSHQSFFPSRSANLVIGSLLGLVTLVPYGYWRRKHVLCQLTAGDRQHRDLGALLTCTVAEYLQLSKLKRLTYRLYRHPVVLLGLGPAYLLIFKHRSPLHATGSWKREWFSVIVTNTGIATLFFALASLIGWRSVLLV